MSLSSETNRVDVTLTSAAQDIAIFYFVDASHVLLIKSDGTVLVETTDYTLSGEGAPGGGTLTTVPTSGNGLIIGSAITILRLIPWKQEQTFDNLGRYPSATVELALDSIAMTIQRLEEILTRSLRLPAQEIGGANMQLAAAASRANKLLGWDSTGTVLSLKDDGTVDGSLTVESSLADAINVTKEGGGSGADVVFDAQRAPYVELTEGKWILSGGVTARTSDAADTVWAQFYDDTDDVAFGGGPAVHEAQTRTGLNVSGTITIPAGETHVVRFKVFCEAQQLDVGSAEGPSGHIIAHRIAV